MKKLMLGTIIATVFSGEAFAANTAIATVNVSADIIKDLSVSDANIAMPDFVKAGAGEPDAGVSLFCNVNGTSFIYYNDNGNPFAKGTGGSSVVSGSKNATNNFFSSTGTCGQAAVTGEANASYSISLNYSQVTNSNGITLKEIKCASEVTTFQWGGRLDSTGKDTIHCGASVTANSTAPSGTTYNLSAEIIVTYD